MRIYPSFHNVRETDRVQPKDLPLSYLSVDSEETEIKVVKDRKASGGNTSTPVMPYEVFDTADPYLFDENGYRVEVADLMQRDGDKYYFLPKNAVEFDPLRFSFNVLVKKEMKYENNKHYNLRVSCVDKDMKLAQKLIAIFGDASRRGLSPLNISVNNQDVSVESLINSSFADNDFVFIESDDGVHYFDSDEPIDFESILNSHTNIWLSVKSFGDLIKDKADNQFTVRTPTIYSTKKYSITGYSKYFDFENTLDEFGNETVVVENPSFPKSQYTYINLFEDECGVMLLESKQKGFILIAEESFFENLSSNSKLVYEILMQVFLQSYYRTPEKNIWITDSAVDFIALQEIKHGLKHEKVRLDELLYNGHYDIGDQYKLIEVTTSNPNVMFQGIGSEQTLLFFKYNLPTDPKKEEDHISVYTTRQTVIQYKKQSINKVENELIVQPIYQDTGNFIVIKPYKSSMLRIHTDMEQVLRVPESHTSFTLSCRDNIFKLMPDNQYNPNTDGLKMANVKVIKNVVTKNYDMRILGGGLPEDYEPNFNLLDIGHIEGRPYRIGSTMIITLPKRLEQYKEIIENAIKRHATSGDYPIILFE